MKKFLALFLALTLVLGLCACGGGSAAGGNDGEGLSAGGKVKLSIGLPVNAYIMDYDNNEMTKWIEEKCGVEIEFMPYAGGTDVATQISTAVNANRTLPDIILGVALDENSIHKYGKDDYFVDLGKYLYTESGEPNMEGPAKIFWDRINNELSEVDRGNVINEMTDPDNGAIYGMPVIETSLIDKMNYMPWINVNWLKEVGLEKPTNNEELLDTLRAFQDLGMPLYGAEKVISSKVVLWLINLFTYYNPSRPFTVSEDGKTLSHAATSDAYRKAMKYCYDLYQEEILNDMAFTDSANSMSPKFTPQNGKAMVGIGVVHLTLGAAAENMVLKEYEPLGYWGNVVRSDLSVQVNTFLTTDCQNPEKAFEVLMTLFSKEGAMFTRYGAKGINWEDADPGAKSDIGFDAEYKIISDPLRMQNTSNWGKMGSTLNEMAEGERAQIADDASEWMKLKASMHAEAVKLFDEAEKTNNPAHICPKLRLTTEEQEQYRAAITNVSTFISRAQTEFIKGERDPYSDADWAAYLKEANDLGLADYVKVYQMAYDRSN